MGIVFDLAVLNVLTLLCSLPVITAGASFTAMHYVLWHMVRGEESYVSKQFFAAFKQNFRQATLLWLGCLAVIAVLGVDALAAQQLSADRRWMAFAALAVVAVAALAVAEMFFVLLSRYQNDTLAHLKNAALLAVGSFPRVLAIVVILASSAVLYISFVSYLIPFMLILGITLPQYCCAWLYNPVLRRLDEGKGRQAQRS